MKDKFKVGDKVMYIKDRFTKLITWNVYVVSGVDSRGEGVSIEGISTSNVVFGWDVDDFVLVDYKVGDLVECSDNGEFWTEKHFLADLSMVKSKDINYLTSEVHPDNMCWSRQSHIYQYKYIRPVKPEVTEFTMDEIAEKLGIPVEQLKIKK